MAWKGKKEWQGKSPANINYPLDELTQKQILKISDTLRKAYFEQDAPKPKKKKKEVKIETDSYNEYTD